MAQTHKTYSEMVETICKMHPEMREDRMIFSDYVIATVITDFMNDPQIKGEHAERKNKAKAMYKDIMKAWEDKYGEWAPWWLKDLTKEDAQYYEEQTENCPIIEHHGYKYRWDEEAKGWFRSEKIGEQHVTD